MVRIHNSQPLPANVKAGARVHVLPSPMAYHGHLAYDKRFIWGKTNMGYKFWINGGQGAGKIRAEGRAYHHLRAYDLLDAWRS